MSMSWFGVYLLAWQETTRDGKGVGGMAGTQHCLHLLVAAGDTLFFETGFLHLPLGAMWVKAHRVPPWVEFLAAVGLEGVWGSGGPLWGGGEQNQGHQI